MSVDTHGHTEHGHHEPVEVVDRRQRMAVWLFIGGDIVTLSAMLFTYLYLRGTNTGGHWMSMLGYDQSHSADYYMNAASLPDPKLIHIHPMSASFSWLVAAVVVVSALILWGGEKTLRAGSQRATQFSATAALATIVAVVAAAMSVIQLRHLPQVFAMHNDSMVWAYTSYSSAMMLLIGTALVHFILLAFLGLGLTIRSARGAVNSEKWHQVRLVRLFWVWTAVSVVVTTALTTTVNTIH